VTRIGEQRMIAVTINLSMLQRNTLIMGAICSSKTGVLTRATWRNIAEDGILHFLISSYK
jgi:hypothetical protein